MKLWPVAHFFHSLLESGNIQNIAECHFLYFIKEMTCCNVLYVPPIPKVSEKKWATGQSFIWKEIRSYRISTLKGLIKDDFKVPLILTLHFQCCLFLIYLAHRHFQHDPIHCNWFAVFGNDPPSSVHNRTYTLVYCSQLFQQSGIFSAGQNWLCLNNKKKNSITAKLYVDT